MFNIFNKKEEAYTSQDIDKIIDSYNLLLENYLTLKDELKMTQKRMEEIELKRAEQYRNLTDLIKKSNLLKIEEKKEDKKSSESSKNKKDLEELINRKMKI